MPAAVFLQYYLYIPQSGSVVAPRIFHFLAELGTACHHGAEQVALMMPWTLGLIGSVMSVIGRGDDPLEPKVLSHAGERVGERLGRHRVLSRPTRQEGETLGISMHVQRDRAVEPEQQRRGPEHGGVRPLALGFDAEVRADFLVRGLHGSTAVEAVEDVTSVGLRIRAQDGLRLTPPVRVAHESLAGHSRRYARRTFGCFAHRVGTIGLPLWCHNAIPWAYSIQPALRYNVWLGCTTRCQRVTRSVMRVDSSGWRLLLQRAQPGLSPWQGGGSNSCASLYVSAVALPVRSDQFLL